MLRIGLTVLCLPLLAAGCIPDQSSRSVPAPINLTLPHEIRIHSFTATRTFEEDGASGIEVHVEARDAFADSVKAFGEFRFELFAFRRQHPDSRGARLAAWTIDLKDPEANALHWRRVSRTYIFRLRCDAPMPPGQRLVLDGTFWSPFTERLFTQRVFTAGG